jgi:predicted ATP-dependent serine protease
MSMKGSSRSKIGVAGLDEILHGGLIPARLYLIDGNPGAHSHGWSLSGIEIAELIAVAHGAACLAWPLTDAA